MSSHNNYDPIAALRDAKLEWWRIVSNTSTCTQFSNATDELAVKWAEIYEYISTHNEVCEETSFNSYMLEIIPEIRVMVKNEWIQKDGFDEEDADQRFDYERTAAYTVIDFMKAVFERAIIHEHEQDQL